MSDELGSTATTSLNYLDFELEISPGTGRDYPVSVVRSPAGEAHATMRFPFDDLALDSRLKDLQIALLRSGGTRRQMLLPEEQSIQDFGRTLLDALLAGEVRSRFDVSRGQARQQGKGLRLKLRIQAPELAALPWEFLYDPRQAEFVCLSRRTPIVRYLELPQPIQPLKVAPPLRVLGLIARPNDLLSLDVDREKQRVEEAVKGLAAKGMIQLEWLPGQTWRNLQRAMRGGPWHILHFVGHGGFNTTADEGYIVLVDEAGQSHPVYATELGRLLADHDPLRLAVLNSCEGARGGVRDIFSSTASILIRQGLPAVLAMQYEISDRAAVEFSRSFYEALADGYPVDASVAEARKAVSMAVENTMEWGTPVLNMRSPDGVLFDIQAAPLAQSTLPLVKATIPALATLTASTPLTSTTPPTLRPSANATTGPSAEPARAERGEAPPSIPPSRPPDKRHEPPKSFPWSRIALMVLALLVVAVSAHEFWPGTPKPATSEATATALPTSTMTALSTSTPSPVPASTSTSMATSLPGAAIDVPLVTTFAVAPQAIVAGQASTIHLTWQTQHADSVMIEPAIGAVEPAGSRDVPAPTADTEYTLVARNTSGETQALAQLKVTRPVCTVLTNGLNLRSGPGMSYDPAASSLAEGSQLEPLAYVASGFPPSGPWLQVKVADTGRIGWVSAEDKYVGCNYDITLAPTPGAIPPTPTYTATATRTPTNTATPTPTPTETPPPPRLVLAKTSFVLPDDGVPNNNGYIGPFCCTGRTATIATTDNLPVGYVYFYTVLGQAYNVGNGSIAPDVSILVSGLGNGTDPYSPQVQNSVDFTAGEMQPGVSRSTRAGALLYTVSVEAVTTVTRDGAPYFDMGSLVVKVDVELP